MRTPLTATITLLVYFQAGVLSVFSSPVSSEYIPGTVVLSQTLDPYTQKHLRLEYAPANQAIFWSLVDQDNTLASESYSLGKEIQSVNIGTIYNGDHISLVGQLTDDNWFIQLITSSGQKLWLHKETVPIYDMAFSQDGQFLYLVGGVDDFSAPLFLVMDSLTGDVVFRQNQPYDTSDKEPGIYKQLVVTDSEEIVVAEHNSKGTLKLSKWEPASHTVHEFVRKGFCESCARTGVKSVAMKKGYLPETAFIVTSYNSGVKVGLIESGSGNLITEKSIQTSIAALWNKTSKIRVLASQEKLDKDSHLFIQPHSLHLNLLSAECFVAVQSTYLTDPVWMDFCQGSQHKSDQLISMYVQFIHNIAFHIYDLLTDSIFILKAGISGLGICLNYVIFMRFTTNLLSKKLSENPQNLGKDQTAPYQLKSLYGLKIQLLETFPISPIPSVEKESFFLAPSHYFVSNEFPRSTHDSGLLDYTKVINFLSNRKHEHVSGIRTAFLIGESSLIHSLPELYRHCDLVLIVDCDPELLEFQIERLKAIGSHCFESSESALTNLIRRTCSGETSCRGQLLNISYQKKCLGQYYVFSSPDRFKESKEALEKLTIIPVQINIFIKDQVLRLSQLLKKYGATIVFINLSNTMDLIHANYFYETNGFDFTDGPPIPSKWVRQLPLCNTCVCAHSIISDVPFENQQICIFDGLDVQSFPSESKKQEPRGFFSSADRLMIDISRISWIDQLSEAIYSLDSVFENLHLVKRLLAVASSSELEQLILRKGEILENMSQNNSSFFTEVSTLIELTIQQYYISQE